MIKMFNLKSLKNIGIRLYLFIYLIFPHQAITQTTKVDLRRDLENALNSRDFGLIKNIFSYDESLLILKKFSKIIKEFPDSKWKIKKLKSNDQNKDIFQIKVIGETLVNGEVFILESNFNYLFSLVDGRFQNGNLNKLFTTIRNDNKKIDITFRIPDEVLTGANYEIDIILNKPLDEDIIAGGIIPYQVDSFLEQEISLEPLVSGGIFKITRAPSKPGIQIWSGIIAHPNGIISFTKSIDIVEKI